jgi:hydroxymethylpyrimidine pyrophosphatase-like HAD family hydrolase
LKTLYVDVDGTLTGPGGDLFYGNSTRVADALVRARVAGLAVVPVSGRGRLQVFELCRLLGLPRGIAELGCVAVEGREVRYQLGGFPFVGETPVEAMHNRGAVDAALAVGLEPFDPWNEGRQATFLLRARPGVDLDAANETLAAQGFGWCELIDNGRAVHLAPTGTGKAAGVHLDREHHGLTKEDTGFVGDSASDLSCAAEVGECWLVANADWPASLEWPWRTTSPFGDGVAEVIDRLLAGNR